MIVNKPKTKKRKRFSRFTVLKVIMGIIFTAILGRLVYLQIVEHSYYSNIASENSIRFVQEDAPRGEILDDQGNILATNKEIYNLTYTEPSNGEVDFYPTLKEVFRIIKENNDKLVNTMLLKMDANGNLYYGFDTNNQEAKEDDQIRYLTDIGMNEAIQTKLYGDAIRALTQQQTDAINKELLTVTPDQAFDYLVKEYNLINLIYSAPTEPAKGASDKVENDYKANLQEYNAQMAKYNKMTGAELLNLIEAKGYSKQDIMQYAIVQDEIKMQSFKGERTVTMASDIKQSTAFDVYQELDRLPGINVQMQPVRYYPYNNLASSVIGYLTPISQAEQAQYELQGYDVSTALVGASGIEAAYQEYLRGESGGKTVKVDSQGRTTATLDTINPYPGDNVHLTINKNVEYALEQSLKDTMAYVRANVRDNLAPGDPSEFNATRGAAIMVDVKNGNILGMASYPDFNPNLFAVSGQLTKAQYDEYFDPNLEAFGEKMIHEPGVTKTVNEMFPVGPDGQRQDKYNLYPKPFYNYATMGAIPPGSIFKPMTSTAVMQEGLYKPGEIYDTPQKFNQYPEVFGKGFDPEGWYGKAYGRGMGPITLQTALQQSSDVFFYDMGFRLYEHALQTTKLKGQQAQIYALNSLARWAWQFGLGHSPADTQTSVTGIEIPENNSGQVYSFESFKADTLLYAKYNLYDRLISGNYDSFVFAPFSIETTSSDSSEANQLKNDIINKVNTRLEAVGTNNPQPDFEQFYQQVYPDVLKLMQTSKQYQESFDAFKAKNPNTNIKQQAYEVAYTIASFTIDEQNQMLSPAQLVYGAIGQGIDNFTPIQLASYIMALANGGTRYRLHLVSEVTSPSGQVLQKTDPEVVDKIPMSQSTIDTIHEGMREVDSTPDGTAYASFGNFPIATAGKTGTADVSSDQRTYGRSPYATYIGFAPYKDPQVAVMVVMYDGAMAQMVAKAGYEAYFKDQLIKDGYKSGSFTKYVLDAPADNYAGSEKTNQENEKLKQQDSVGGEITPSN
ncbi:penicillin-binding transpeptidase domain-containing protein [uncultured Clostridium sp.]|uniref:peptidoglycan D,D-transpeptidase FtsI family protein n=1 Tax=uncultured Clostridium sp. TaxID=59620 RepID=UPI002617A646|nr:penicillin-binding transpeptidase domain-containing protein [uncultured Clostridium sp.]